MSASAAPAPAGPPTLTIRGRSYPVLLPKLRDPRLHLAATITSLQVIGQVGFQFRVSIAQILISLLTCAVLEVGIALRRQHVLLWPASAMLTGNGVAFVLRVPGTHHGDWWSLRGWWIFVATAAVSLLSKHVIQIRGAHPFNPSNIGLVLCFLLLPAAKAEPLDFWWGPMSTWLALALIVILTGGFAILSRLKLLRVALSFWAAFAVGIGVLAAAGHQITARWHLGPIQGIHFWWLLVTSPEVLVFLFFMITDPKTAPRGPRPRVAYAVAIGLLAALLVAPMHTEYWTKVGLLGALALVCVGQTLLQLAPSLPRPSLRVLAPVCAVAAAAYAAALVAASPAAQAVATMPLPKGQLPTITILPSRGVQTQLTLPIARVIARALVDDVGSGSGGLRLWLEPGQGQDPPIAVAQLAGATYKLHQQPGGQWALGAAAASQPVSAAGPVSRALTGTKLEDVASSVGLDFQQGSFHFAMSNDYKAMMGGGVCWLDYNGDGWLDLFAVNSYSSADTSAWQSHGGLPRSALFENDHGTFHDVATKAHAGLQAQGDGCVAADLNGDGHPDLVETTTSGVDLLWNDGDGTFTEGARAAGLRASGWYTGAAVADVNGDGRADLFVAGYTDLNEPVPGSIAGFPTNYAGVRDLLYLNEGNGPDGRARFREVGVQAGLESASPRHGLGATFTDVNGDGRPDLYVADDEDPNQLYVDVSWPGGAAADPEGLGFRFEERAAAAGVADPFAGMGVATTDAGALFVTNSRNEPSGAYVRRGGSDGVFASAQADFDPALGTGFAGWGTSWVDLANSGTPDLVLAAGAIPVTSLSGNAEPVRVLAPRGGGRYGDATAVLGSGGLKLNGRGLAAADADNDGRLEVAVNTIGGKLVLLRSAGPAGHWLDVGLSRFAPGSVVRVDLPGGRSLSQRITAGSSYLSSEDPRAHFGLGAASRVTRIVVRYTWGASTTLGGRAADRIVEVAVPSQPATRRSVPVARAAGCTPATHGRSVARLWNETAVAMLRAGDASEPVQARDLFDLSAAVHDAWAAYDPTALGYFVREKATAADVLSARETAIDYAAYRLLLWRASFDANLQTTFGLLTARLRSLCGSPAFTSTAGGSPAALGNRIAAAVVAAGKLDGSLEAEHYVDAGYAPQNAPLLVAQPGSSVHDATFWQPLALTEITARGLGPVPAQIQTFVDSQWGRLRGVAGAAPLDTGAPPLGDPSGARYKQAAVDVIRATAGQPTPVADASPLHWNLVADALPSPTGAAARLQADVTRSFVLDAALHDTAIAVWRAKRAYQSPRPISMIRYLAFSGQSSDRSAPAYSADGLPLVPGLVELRGGKVLVRSGGRWVAGAAWTPPVATPASPGWVAEGSAFASAAAAALRSLTGRSYDAQAAAASRGVAEGIQVPADVAAGRTLGRLAAARAIALASRYR